ncbi:Alpha/Beta hydrolase protein [Cryomyces antarcticus]
MVNWILGDLFLKDFGHQGSIKTLWETRWKFPCKLGVYPFHDGKFEDFEPIFNKLVEGNVNDPYDDAFASAFFPTAEALAKEAQSLESSDRARAIELYRRSACVYRLSRFPYIGTPLKRKAYEEQKKVYMRGARLWDVPLTEEIIPFTDAVEGDGKEIPLYVRTPKDASKEKPVPVMLLVTGLDGHRPDNYERTEEHLKRGWATVICDIPGVADCPALKTDPKSSDRLFTTILNWIKSQPQLNEKKVIAWGLSAGGYHAIRLAHTHASQLAGAVGHGAGTHHYIGAEWLKEVNHHEYPFDLRRAYLGKYGYGSWEELVEKCQKDFSLVDNGIVNQMSCRLLLINGMLDGCMPVEDSMLLMEYGRPKEARFIQGRAHMGYPEANSVVFPWLEEVMGTAS